MRNRREETLIPIAEFGHKAHRELKDGKGAIPSNQSSRLPHHSCSFPLCSLRSLWLFHFGKQGGSSIDPVDSPANPRSGSPSRTAALRPPMINLSTTLHNSSRKGANISRDCAAPVPPSRHLFPRSCELFRKPCADSRKACRLFTQSRRLFTKSRQLFPDPWPAPAINNDKTVAHQHMARTNYRTRS